MRQNHSILLIGAGNMGGALLEGWVRAGALETSRSAVVDPSPSDHVLAICEERRIEINPPVDQSAFDVCVLAVKPNLLSDVLPGLCLPHRDKTIFVSVAAGITVQMIAQFMKDQNDDPAIVRAMPNLPVAQGLGMTLLATDTGINSEARSTVYDLFHAVGGALWCQSEDQLDRLMGISGCGPAYIYLLCEALEAAATEQGASAEEARLLAEMTIRGAASQLGASDRPASALREAVTSPKGTTAAALRVLGEEQDTLPQLVSRAVKAAYARSGELRS